VLPLRGGLEGREYTLIERGIGFCQNACAFESLMMEF
jgi:hypothetical protein